MKKYIFFFILFFLPFTTFCQPVDSSSNDVMKLLLKSCWLYKENTSGTSTVLGYDQTEIKKMTRNLLCFNNDSITILKDTFLKPTYCVTKVNAKHFMVENELSPTDINTKSDYLFVIKISSKIIPKKYTNKNFEYFTEVVFINNDLYLFGGNLTFHYVRFVKNVSRNAN